MAGADQRGVGIRNNLMESLSGHEPTVKPCRHRYKAKRSTVHFIDVTVSFLNSPVFWSADQAVVKNGKVTKLNASEFHWISKCYIEALDKNVWLKGKTCNKCGKIKIVDCK